MVYDETTPLFRSLVTGLSDADRLIGEMRMNVAEQMAEELEAAPPPARDRKH